jgi:hypothetical protein
MTADSAPSVANHREPADERMLGVDDLVNAIIELNTSTSFDIKEYLRARIELLRLELGAVDGELRHFGAIFEDSLFNGIVGDPFTSDRVIQIPGLEAPWWLADPLNAMRGRLDEIIRRAHELNNAVVEVRKDWIRAALVSAEPALEHRRTTERRLEQRGLGERPRIVNQDFDWDDY